MEQTKLQTTSAEDILAQETEEAELFIMEYDGRAKALMSWYHGCTTSFIRQMKELSKDMFDGDDFLDDMACFGRMQSNRMDTMSPYNICDDDDDDEEFEESEQETTESNDADDFSLSEEAVSEEMLETYRILLDDLIRRKAQLTVGVKEIRDRLQTMNDKITAAVNDGNQESGE